MSHTDSSSFCSTSDLEDDSQSSVSGSMGGVDLIDIGKLSIKDNEQEDGGNKEVHHATEVEGHGCIPATEPYRPPFVIKGTEANADDVFRATPRASSQRTPTGPKNGRGHHSGNWRSSPDFESSDIDNSPSRDKVQRDAKRGCFANRTPKAQRTPSRDSNTPQGNSAKKFDIINDEDAQAKFPPSCCVFVANLLQSETEEALQVAVTKVFSEYGVVFVKIRRDHTRMPFAFCQYTDPRHAERAIREGRGRLIAGRPCRTEKAKAHREFDSLVSKSNGSAENSRGIFLVERKSGPVVTPEEAREMMSRFGAITKCYTSTSMEQVAYGINKGVIVEFEMYDEGQAAHAGFRGNEEFKVTPIQGLGTPPKSDPAHRAYLDRYSSDRSSIFIGALPADATEAQLRQLFEPFGPIVEIDIKCTASKYDENELVYFCFIEFQSWDSVSRVLGAKHGIILNGKPLRISQKGVHLNPTRRRVQDDSPAHRRPALSASPIAVSPMAPHSPPNYNYGFYGYSPMSYTAGASTVYTDGQGQYYYYASPHTSPSYYSPSYTAASPAQQTYWSQSQPYYWGGYSAPTYGPVDPCQQQASSNAPPYPPPYVGTTNAEDRSSTPTPPAQGSIVESQ